VKLEENEARGLRLEDKVGESEMDGVPVPLREPLEEEEGDTDSVPLTLKEKLALEQDDSDGVALAQKLDDAVTHGVLVFEEDKQLLDVEQLDAEAQGLAVAEIEGDRDCIGDAVQLRVVGALRDTVDDIVGNAEAVVDADKQPLSVADPEYRALPLLVTESVGDRETEGLEVTAQESIGVWDSVDDTEEHTVLVNEVDEQPL
jgi:hypothetical protein